MTFDLPDGWPGYLIGALGSIFLLIPALRKNKTDQTAVLLEGWQKMYDAHERRIAEYEGRIKTLVEENGAILNRLRDAENRILHLERTVLEKDVEIAALTRKIGQISQSTAAELSRRRPLDKGPSISLAEDEETIAALDRAGGNSMAEEDSK